MSVKTFEQSLQKANINHRKFSMLKFYLDVTKVSFKTERSTNEVIARVLGTSMKKIDRVKKRFVMGGIETTLTNKKGSRIYKKRLMEILKPTWLR